MSPGENCSGSLCQREIAGAASMCLQASPHSFLRRVICECDRGILTLRGRVSSFYGKQLAQEAVAGVTGILQVDNKIEVA